MVALGTLGGSTSYANGINNLNQIVGRAYLKGDRTVHVCLWPSGATTPTDLNSLKNVGANSLELLEAYRMNTQGGIIGRYSTTKGTRAVLRRGGGRRERNVVVHIGECWFEEWPDTSRMAPNGRPGGLAAPNGAALEWIWDAQAERATSAEAIALYERIVAADAPACQASGARSPTTTASARRTEHFAPTKGRSATKRGFQATQQRF